MARSRGLGDVYKRQVQTVCQNNRITTTGSACCHSTNRIKLME
jgi:hypothetical protein